jgi:CBS domain-containing protein
MSAEQSAADQKHVPQTPADKTDAPRRARRDSINLLETNAYARVQPATPLSEAIERMKQQEAEGCVIVCETDGRIAGIFTEDDLLAKIVGEELDMSAPVSNYMSPVSATLAPDATLGDAVRLMNESGARVVPLVKDGQLAGALSVSDIIRYLAETYPKETINLPPVTTQFMDTQEGG